MSQPSALELAQALIRAPSVTPEDNGALDVVADALKAAGFAVSRRVFSEEGTPDVANLYARYGTKSPLLLFAGHTDVTPPGDEASWRRPPFAAEIVGDELYGRGAVDMKGAIAAKIAAVLAFIRERPDFKGSIGFLITGDEEGPAINGTVKLLEWAQARGETFDHCLLGEPTNPERLGEMIKIGRRGSLTGRLTVEGVQGHVGYPHLARNPIDGMLRLLTALKAEPLDGGTEHFDPSNLEITGVDVGNTATNVVPGRARAVFNIRFNDIWTPQTLGDEIRRRLAAAAGEEVEFELAFDPTNSPAFLTQPDDFVELVRDAVEAETGLRPALSTTGGTSDARFIKSACPVVEFGLVGQTMHKIDERVPLADLERLTAIYRGVLERYFAP
ncbi:MAG: succinyl-diaminopimelate desuccinylase [Salinarimonadaceae bacterium]|nr:MAG: succinyl-diaminopimelate desuccinylase [Salinarimonadaceae bacterium]